MSKTPRNRENAITRIAELYGHTVPVRRNDAGHISNN